MSQDIASRGRASHDWSNATMERGIVDLYARRVSMMAESSMTAEQDALDRVVVTRPFGRPFAAQPSFPPDLDEADVVHAGALAGLRRRLSSGNTPTRKLATS
ncbi:MAG: hypothetical protein E6R14_05800 [Thermomicrobiales bacterium]|nr:MAG: hypothetical protein E6R14_05800 [Thermomicrobiales bacterium]